MKQESIAAALCMALADRIQENGKGLTVGRKAACHITTESGERFHVYITVRKEKTCKSQRKRLAVQKQQQPEGRVK